MISMDKKYRYRNGEPARILCTDRTSNCATVFPVIALNLAGNMTVHSIEGKAGHSTNSDWDLIEVFPYEEFKMDDPVMARFSNGHEDEFRRHFAGIDASGNPLVWNGGQTQFTCQRYKMCKTAAISIRRPTLKELAGE